MKTRTLIAVLLLILMTAIMYFPHFYKKEEVPVKVEKFDSTYSFKNLNRGL